MNQHYKVIGLMSGTSVDGLDVVYCTFEKHGTTWHFSLLNAETIAYPSSLESSLKNSLTLNNNDLDDLDQALGMWFGKTTKAFIDRHHLEPSLISSHGHTVYHQPVKGITRQIGDGNQIYNICRIPVVYDFRTADVAQGGQGAPLVPIGDKFLFPEYSFCLNLGGFTNISFERDNLRLAYDICACNVILNMLAERVGNRYDPEGEMASGGELIHNLRDSLNNLDFYKLKGPKSLGLEWVEENILPLLAENYPPQHLLRTYTEHIAERIGKDIADIIGGIDIKTKGLLITGGGVFNRFLIDRIKKKISGLIDISIPDPVLISFKEALIFAFMGVLRVRNEENILKSVTGARRNSCSGTIAGQ